MLCSASGMFTKSTVQCLDLLRLTCVFGKLLKEFISIPILRDISNKETMVVKRNCHTKFFPFPQFVIIQLKISNTPFKMILQ